MQRGMAMDFGWELSARRYLALYNEMTGLSQAGGPGRQLDA
jgi:glycogen synthase